MSLRNDLAVLYYTGVDAQHSAVGRALIERESVRIREDFMWLSQHVHVRFCADDPYGLDFVAFCEDRDNGCMSVYTGNSDKLMWSPELNWMSRALHDEDHYVCNAPFTFEGELTVYLQSSALCPANRALYLSEILMQAAYAEEYGYFAPQKLVIVPDHIIAAMGL